MSATHFYELFSDSYHHYSNSNRWDQVFMVIYNEYERSMCESPLSRDVALSKLNSHRNRYTNILPYDEHRIKITPSDDNQDGYINASPVDVEEINRKYILCQGPLESTAADFWQMIWEQKVPLIVMLNNLIEAGCNKCYDYYPTSQKENLEFGNWKIELREEISKGKFVHRTLVLQNNEEETRTVHHVQYSEWADFGVPPSSKCFLSMLKYIKDLNLLSKSIEDPPTVVHCSAGVGRSGSFIFIDSMIRMVELDMLPPGTISDFLNDLRRQRCGLIQTPAQLRFTWMAVLDYLEETYGDVIHGAPEEEIQNIEEEKTANGSTNNESSKEDEYENIEKSKLSRKTSKRISLPSDTDEKYKEVLDQESETTKSKRRDRINQMLKKSRQADARDAWNKTLSKVTCSVGVAAAAVLAAYYFARF